MKAFRWLAPIAALALSAWSQPLSHVRIVRISLTSGDVQLNLQDGRGWQKAMLNAPISESDQLRTGAGARAEVELEDGSTVRLIPDSAVTFQALALSEGKRLTTVELAQGSALFTLFEKDALAFTVAVPEGQITTPYGATAFRVDLSENGADVRVLSGKTNVAAAGQQYLLKKNETLSMVGSQPAELAKSKSVDEWDRWSKSRDQAILAKSNQSTSVFGFSELSSFGRWDNGCWSPMGMGMGWNPWMSGNWFFDPVAGYNWVSPYQWGWLPYHFGSWMMGSGGGYCWSPGMSMDTMFFGDPWMFFQPYPRVIGPGGMALAAPVQPPTPLSVRFPQTSIAGGAPRIGSPAGSRPLASMQGAALSSSQRAALQRASQTERVQSHEIQAAREREFQAARAQNSAAWGSSGRGSSSRSSSATSAADTAIWTGPGNSTSSAAARSTSGGYGGGAGASSRGSSSAPSGRR